MGEKPKKGDKWNPGAKRMFECMQISFPDLDCPCITCYDTRVDEAMAANPKLSRLRDFANVMHCCPTCGNKRCPHATNHIFDCTGSNDTGQPGSVYV